MNINKLNFTFIISLITILIASCTPKKQDAFEPRDPMIEDIEYSFIHMDEYLPIKTVDKADKPFVFPSIDNKELPQEFDFNGATFNTMHYIDSSYTKAITLPISLSCILYIPTILNIITKFESSILLSK